MNILVTGGAGYIGSHIVKLLLEDTDYNITILDNLVTGFESAINDLKKIRSLVFIKEDLSNWKNIETILKENKFNTIIHLAGSLIVPESITNPLKYYLNNTANTTNLVKLATSNKINKFIFSSTAAVYGEPSVEDANNGIDEDFYKNPINPYGKSKLFSEKIIQDVAKINDEFKYIILRYFNVAGASPDLTLGQKTMYASNLIKVTAETAIGKRMQLSLFGTDYPTHDGTCIRDYIHVMDLAIAHIKALKYLEKNNSDIFNCGYATGFSVKEVIDTVEQVSKKKLNIQELGRRKGDPAVMIADSKKIKQKMNWTPKYNDIKFICKTALDWEKKMEKNNEQ